MADIADELIMMERSAEEEREKLAGLDGEEYAEQWRRWRKAAETFQAAVTEYAAREDPGMSRYDLEMAVKVAVRHPEEAAAA
ncbi:hypothetical protein RM704_10500 [Streptomyces sp. DSM 3412]|uniref:Uncharacterized protein n=1 Tax=Streptomyces gottesmaniae TaxID=3075518 RepID=A0ABU2YU93_9ACTN|nr:hypothetical protein [Streptomyces sp. DSM 3412]MDT0567894.1 hypothetical protein [Streptomyces sp. DSM 3412]